MNDNWFWLFFKTGFWTFRSRMGSNYSVVLSIGSVSRMLSLFQFEAWWNFSTLVNNISPTTYTNEWWNSLYLLDQLFVDHSSLDSSNALFIFGTRAVIHIPLTMKMKALNLRNTFLGVKNRPDFRLNAVYCSFTLQMLKFMQLRLPHLEANVHMF